ncbi:CHAT domain-containing protein [Catellatospora methionotrophica]|uniref:CHAT domain-containing protein n=1 Tax=Catellatospora methionotrophica TaxID=121620 RepID=UPI0034011AA5
MTADGLDAARRTINALADRWEGNLFRGRDDVNAAIASARAAIATLQKMARQREQLIELAVANQLLGELYLLAEDLDRAIDSFDDANNHFLDAGGDSEEYGQFLFNVAATFADQRSPEAARELAARARTVLARYGPEHLARVDELLADLAAVESGHSEVRIEQRREAVRRAPRGLPRAVAAQAVVVELVNGPDVREHVAEIHSWAEVAYQNLADSGSLDQLCTVLTVLIDLYWLDLPLPGWAGPVVRSTLDRAMREERTDLQRNLLILEAGLVHQRGDAGTALHAALHAAARHDEHVLATSTSHVRSLASRVGQGGREMAVHLAVLGGHAQVAAELIEGARLQVIPVSGASDSGRERSWIGGLRPVAVGGRSAVAPRYRRSLAAPIELETSIARIGGPAACWWGTWAVNGRVYWALRVGGRWSCGQLRCDEDSPLGRLVVEAMRTSMHEPSATTRDRITGPWCRSAAAEELLSVDIGELLIPPDLRAAMIDPERTGPLSLVVAGNLHTQLPMALLGIRPGPFTPALRLIEAAVIRVAPPSVLVDQIAEQPPEQRATYDVAVACVDPRGDLRHSGSAPTGARQVLGSAASGRMTANRANLSRALTVTGPGAPGIFLYSGHAVSPGLDGDEEDGLALADGEILSAATLFSPEGARFPFPSRAVISACQSAGAAGSGAGEWLGLSAGLIWRGSRQIVATHWKIWDTPFTSEFDLDLVERIRTAPDVAAALRDAQLAALRRWAASDHDFSTVRVPGLPASAARLPLPLIWAAYCCTGVLT